MELARIIPPEKAENLGLVFFDIEDQGNIDGWEWILGSRAFVSSNHDLPEKMILLDMVAGHVQTIQPPVNSDKKIYQEIQSIANGLGYGANFLDPSLHGITDDHVPFLEAGIPSVDLIDIIDPNWHTTSDDLENVNLSSIQKAGETLFVWIMTR
jgi:Zn-dependent M28 family amino/carboxypeptidase